MRNWIYQALVAILINKEYSNLYLRHHLSSCPAKDQALATRIVYGTIQNFGFLNYVIDQYARGKVNKKLRILLTMSLYQLFYLDKVPAYAIINEANDICKAQMPGKQGFVNALLHKANLKQITYPEDPIEALAIQTSLPAWLLKMWKAQYGMQEMERFAKASLSILPIYVRRNSLRSQKEDFDHPDFTWIQDEMYLYHGNDVAHHPYYQKGWMSVQDPGSYQIALFLEVSNNMDVLDTCSAPGTKAMAMVEMMKDQGTMTCLDLYPHRVQLIDNEKKRLGFHCVKTYVQDATKIDDLPLYDRILCDVPCSGYGVLSRKPDITQRISPTDMDTLIPLQKEILEQASRHLKTKGILVYSTCTMNKKENEKQVQSFLKAHPGFSLKEEKTIFPSQDHDGFYMAKLVKDQEDLI